MIIMEKWKIDIPVFMIFFNRPDSFEHVFEAVRQAKPSKLFLACDGPRANRGDEENIAKCKEIASNIDWECEVYQNYSEVNLGCGMRMYSGLNWTFKHVDRAIILEDDCVPHQDFFPFCKELLEKYKDDDRIATVCGMNHLEIYDKAPADYFFGQNCCWGWATWKNRWDAVDFQMDFLDDPYYVDCVTKLFPYRVDAWKTGRARREKLNRGERLSAWTYQHGMAISLNNRISIIPKKNLVTNIGLTEDSTHAVNSKKKMAKKITAYFGIPTYSYEFPLKHPKYIVEDRMYYEAVRDKFKLKFFDIIEDKARRVIYADKGELKKIIKKLFKK